MADDQVDPRHRSMMEVGLHHLSKRPDLEMRSEDRRVEDDLLARSSEADAQVDVLEPEPLRIESTDRFERFAAHRAEAGPEGADGAGRSLMDVVVQQIAEARDDSRSAWGVIVGAEDGGRLRPRLEQRAQATDRIGMHDDVRVDEDEDVAGGDRRALVAREAGARAGSGLDDDDLGRCVVRRPDRREAGRERLRVVCRGNDQREHAGARLGGGVAFLDEREGNREVDDLAGAGFGRGDLGGRRNDLQDAWSLGRELLDRIEYGSESDRGARTLDAHLVRWVFVQRHRPAAFGQ